jgi:uncharacterized protein YjdB
MDFSSAASGLRMKVLAAVATIGPDGLVHAVTPGVTTITATIDTVKGTVQIPVLTPAASVVISRAPDSLVVAEVGGLLAVALDQAGQVLTDRRFHWTSSDTTIATVSEHGELSEITGLSPGTVTVSARSSTVTASVNVRVVAAATGVAMFR